MVYKEQTASINGEWSQHFIQLSYLVGMLQFGEGRGSLKIFGGGEINF